MLLRSLTAAALSVFALAAVGCAAPTTEADNADDGASDAQAAQSSCSPAAYNEGLASYKEAVRLAKLHKTDACAEDQADLMSIAGRAGKAVAACSAFEEVIRTSPWARPLREELAGTLALAELTGALDPKTMNGIDEVLASGVTLWGPAPGAYGNMSRIEFGAGGSAKLFTAELTPAYDNVIWKDAPATYTVKVAGGKATVVITPASGAAKTYELSADPIALPGYEGTPDFIMNPVGREDSNDVFRTYVSECEA